MGKPKKSAQTLWTTPANPRLKLGGKGKRKVELSAEELERQLQERLKPFETKLDPKTLDMPTGHPRMPEIETLLSPEGYDALPCPDDKAITESLAPGEACVRACMGRVDGADSRGVHVTMRDQAGEYSRATLAAKLFQPKAYRDMRFLLLIVAPRQARRSSGQKSIKHVCRVKVLPPLEIRLSKKQAAELRLSDKGART
ncbi:MAG: hypothetical protein WC641_02925 [Patescibacteria group bacterium]